MRELHHSGMSDPGAVVPVGRSAFLIGSGTLAKASSFAFGSFFTGICAAMPPMAKVFRRDRS